MHVTGEQQRECDVERARARFKRATERDDAATVDDVGQLARIGVQPRDARVRVWSWRLARPRKQRSLLLQTTTVHSRRRAGIKNQGRALSRSQPVFVSELGFL